MFNVIIQQYQISFDDFIKIIQEKNPLFNELELDIDQLNNSTTEQQTAF